MTPVKDQRQNDGRSLPSSMDRSRGDRDWSDKTSDDIRREHHWIMTTSHNDFMSSYMRSKNIIGVNPTHSIMTD